MLRAGTDATQSLPITGERTVPDVPAEAYWFARHVVAYQFVISHVLPGAPGARLLEAGCGEGYGAAMLRDAGADVVALDYDADASRHAARRYGVSVLRANLVALPVADATMDVVVSLQTVEHLWDQPQFVAECLRVLRPGGLLVLATPNRLTFPPGNVFHPKELDAEELGALLTGDAPSARAAEVALFGVRHGSRIMRWESTHGSLVDAQIAALPDTWTPELAQVVATTTGSDFVIEAGVPGELADSLDLIAVARAR